MFRETITHAHGVTVGTASEQHAVMLLVRAVRRGYDVEATATGGAQITWGRMVFGPGGGVVVRAERSIELEPVTLVGLLSITTRTDLDLIDRDRHARYVEERGRRVLRGLLWCIPATTTARLLARGLVVEGEDGRVRVSLAARLALLAQDHRTRTTVPDGWHRPHAGDRYGSVGLNRPGRRAGLLRDSTSVAVCTCGELSAHGGDRADARRLATDHRRAVAAAFIAEQLSPR
ncbi:hypothetical protein [Streptomyces sp. NPDC054771]